MKNPLGSDFIVLPEMFITPYENEVFLSNSINETDDFFERIGQIAKRQNAYIVAGSIPFKEEERLYNTTFVFNRNGEVIATYKKIHLYSITYPNGEHFNEGDVIKSGEQVVTFQTEFGIIGLAICFDVRFPLLFRELRKKNAKAIIVPAAFNSYTGPNHWELLFRTRSIDNQLYTIGVSPAKNSYGNYQYYGHSIVVSPFGEVLFDALDKEGISVIDVDLSQVDKERRRFPIVASEKTFLI